MRYCISSGRWDNLSKLKEGFTGQT